MSSWNQFQNKFNQTRIRIVTISKIHIRRRNFGAPIESLNLMLLTALFLAMYGSKENDSVPATFQLLYMIGWKPHESQPKPLKRGAVPKGFNIKKEKS